MHTQYTHADFAGQALNIGLDVGLKHWDAAFYLGQAYHKTVPFPPDPPALMRYAQRTFPGATVRVVYEAGYFGFWIHEAFVKLGAECLVVNPADVPTADKERRFKTNRIDAVKLGRSLANGDIHGIYVPGHRAQQNRSLVRMRSTFVRKQTRVKCQIKAYLRYYHIEHSEELSDRYWSRAYIRWLESVSLEFDSATEAFKMLLKELLDLRADIAQITKRIHRLALEDHYRTDVLLLRAIPGISVTVAMIFLSEVVTITRFKGLDPLASFFGLVPGQNSTGDTETDTGLTPRRNAALRYMIIECAWIAQREDPALLKAFTEYCTRMPKNVAIVHIARKLLNRMRYVLIHQEPYVTGVLANG